MVTLIARSEEGAALVLVVRSGNEVKEGESPSRCNLRDYVIWFGPLRYTEVHLCDEFRHTQTCMQDCVMLSFAHLCSD